ncbi:MAG TPA: BTAD domain-containing putative transcriptional regulator, partial [Streptosporangiaceae bacterium]|nr:BTAD domain-containing putative transcriptional regulator [Streptosporangiaceae bacterium]
MTAGSGMGADGWRFGLLGPMEVWQGSTRIPVNAPREQALLAVLLLNADRVVAAERLMELVWGDDPPAGTKDTMHTLVWRLRRQLGAVLVTSPPGYVVRVRPDQVDVQRFEAQLQLGRRAAAAGRAAQAADLLGSALALWRGEPLAGVAAEGLCRMECPRLAELHLQAVEARIDALLALGEHQAVVGELSSLVAAHPLREGLSGQIMTALYRCGRQAEALQVYQELRRALDEELGVEPGSEVRRLHQGVLRADPMLDLPPPAPPAQAGAGLGSAPPAQLPADVAGFSGRAGYLAELDGLLTARDCGGSVAIAAIDGTTGVGKTALAVHWAHQVRDRFKDGQLHLNLRGHDAAAPMSPGEALSRLLRALGVAADQIPVEVDEAAALYRTLLAERRMLVVLDNASSADQVRPLLPGSPGCLVLVTSRDQLGGLVARDGAHRLGLGVLGPQEAEALLATMLGGDRVHDEPEATMGLASACARLPLALRIAAANITGRSGLSIGDYLAELVQGDRLSALAVAGDKQAAVQAAFDLSYRRLSGPQRRMFRLLGLVPGLDVSVSGAALLAETTVRQAGDALSALATAHLVEESARGRYTFHDLLRLYARQRVTSEESEPDRQAARRRLVSSYLSEVDAAARLLYPEKLRLPLPATRDGRAHASFDSPAAALAWLDAERPNLTAAVADAAEHGLGPMAWLLADALRGYFYLSMHTTDWRQAAQAALAAARSEGHLRAQAAAHLSLADLDWRASRHREAISHYTEAVTLSQQAGWAEGEATALGNLGTVHWQAGRLDTAAEHCRRALAIHRHSGNLGGQAIAVGNLGTVCWQAGRLAEASRHHAEALVLNRRTGS